MPATDLIVSIPSSFRKGRGGGEGGAQGNSWNLNVVGSHYEAATLNLHKYELVPHFQDARSRCWPCFLKAANEQVQSSCDADITHTVSTKVEKTGELQSPKCKLLA